MYLVYVANGHASEFSRLDVTVEVVPLGVAPTLGEAERIAEALRATARARRDRRREIVAATEAAVVAERGPRPTTGLSGEADPWAWADAFEAALSEAFEAEGFSRVNYGPEAIHVRAFEAPERYL